jgi:hypothetical protein
VSGELVTCPRCRRDGLKRGRGSARAGTGIPSHKCRHEKRCVDVNDPDHCTLCRAVHEVAQAVREPSCVFCTGPAGRSGLDCYAPDFARGGCPACGMPGGGTAGRSKHGDPALLAEIEASMVDIFRPALGK